MLKQLVLPVSYFTIRAPSCTYIVCVRMYVCSWFFIRRTGKQAKAFPSIFIHVLAYYFINNRRSIVRTSVVTHSNNETFSFCPCIVCFILHFVVFIPSTSVSSTWIRTGENRVQLFETGLNIRTELYKIRL